MATVNLLVVAGGASGGAAGGGGAGGYRVNSAFVVTPQAYTITVGTGGAAQCGSARGNDGNDSIFSTITSIGGGAGGGATLNADTGGSGGGGKTNSSGGVGTSGQGNNGGAGDVGGNGGGGGASGAVGVSAINNGVGGAGGVGTSNSISGSAVIYAAGGGGSGTVSGGAAGSVGAGAGIIQGSKGANATANTGSGGGGGQNGSTQSGAGGDGVVIIAYKTDGSDGVSTSSTGGSITTSGAYTIHTFTTSGTWTMVATNGIAFDSTATGGSGTPVSSITFSHTCSGSNRILFVSAVTNISNGTTLPTATYNGVSMTVIDYNGAAFGSVLFGLVAPATGANNVVVTQFSTANVIVASSLSFTGASQTGFPDNFGNSSSASTTSYSQSVTSVADNCFAVMAGYGNAARALTAGANTTIAHQDNAIIGEFSCYTTAATTPAGSITLAVSSTIAEIHSSAMATFAPFVAPTNSGKFLSIM